VGKGHFRRGISAFAFTSLARVNPRDTPTLIAKAAQEIKAIQEPGNPGLAEQLNLQLERLSDESLPDLEMICTYQFPMMGPLVPPRWQCKYNSIPVL
jgi:hypothetical protein